MLARRAPQTLPLTTWLQEQRARSIGRSAERLLSQVDLLLQHSQLPLPILT
jgi:hypothetical protein